MLYTNQNRPNIGGLPMQLDLSKLSPTGRRDILLTVQALAGHQEVRISNDLKDYADSQARSDMEGWRDGAKGLKEACSLLLIGE